jgi:nucleotide-binding universal stress UspA family protein
MKNILVPIDFSPVSRAVVATAVRLARLTRSRLVLVNVVPPPPVLVSDFGPVYEDMGPLLKSMQESADRELAKFKASVGRGKTPVSTIRLFGQPGPVILAEAQKRQAAYIVLGSHGHTSFYDLVVGSTASLVLKRSMCPVLVVPARRSTANRKRK